MRVLGLLLALLPVALAAGSLVLHLAGEGAVAQGGGIIVITRNQSHANAKHVEAQALRTRYYNRLCSGLEMWYSLARGTLLILCGVNGPEGEPLWGGLVYRVTEDQGRVFLGEEAYECSVFVERRKYWDWVIARDGYVPLAVYPDLERLLFQTFGQ